MADQAALEVYQYFTLLVAIIPIPVGYFSDKYLGQKRAVILGGGISLVGVLLVFLNVTEVFYLSILLIGIGTGFIRVNLPVLVGRLYPKTDRKRNIGFLLYFMGINVGAFLGTFLIATIAEQFGFEFGFGAVAIGVILALGTFITQMDKLDIRELEEDPWQAKINEIGEEKPPVKQPITLVTLQNGIALLMVLCTLSCIYLIVNDYLNQVQYEVISSFDNVFIDSIGIGLLNASNFISFLSILGFILLLIYWRVRGVGKSYPYLIASFLLLGLGAGVMLIAAGEVYSRVAYIGPLGFLVVGALVEVFIFPISFSLVTRIAPFEQASTWVGLFMGIPATVLFLVQYFLWYGPDGASAIGFTSYGIILTCLVVSILTSISLFLARGWWKDRAGVIE